MENSKFKVKCGQHKDETIKFIELSPQTNSNNKIIFCDSCLTSANVKGKLFKIKSIIQNKSIENWPYSGHSLDQSKVNELKQVIDEIQQNVINQCSEFKNKIIEMIDSYQKQIIIQLSDLNVEIEQTKQNDNKMNQISDLLLNTQTSDDLEQQLKSLISSLQNNPNPIQSTRQKVNKSKEIPDLINKTYKDILDSIDLSLKYSLQKIDCFFLNQSNNYSVIEQLNMKPTKLYNGQDNIIIQTNQLEDIVLQLNPSSSHCQAVSEYIFDKTKKYLIRIQIEGSNKNSFPMIGLIRKNKVDNSLVYVDNLFFYFSSGLCKILKGSDLFNTYPKEIEIFISFPDNKMMVTDYPNYTIVNTLQDDNDSLIEYQDLCLGFAQGHICNLKYIIKECNIISYYPQWVI